MSGKRINGLAGHPTETDPGKTAGSVLKDKLRRLPEAPGVYIMKDARGGILYVGKSKHLKNRVSSYFHRSKSHAPKIKRLVQHVQDLEIIRTDTEFEALLLECSLIHKFKPMYNRKMKNPASYAYIVIPASAGLRHFETTRQPLAAPGDEVFGPYPASELAVQNAVQTILESFKIACSPAAAANAPCLNHDIGLCLGMCLGGTKLAEYRQRMERFIGLLHGTDRSLCDEVEREMAAAAGRFDFEAAARYRDVLQAIRFLERKRKSSALPETTPMCFFTNLWTKTRSSFFSSKGIPFSLAGCFPSEPKRRRSGWKKKPTYWSRLISSKMNGRLRRKSAKTRSTKPRSSTVMCRPIPAKLCSSRMNGSNRNRRRH
ncbi:GIY-YIG nuclease family protein [Paenibacillus sp. JTLBN-2024]